MDSGIGRQMEELRRSSTRQIRAKYREVFGEEPRTKHREQLFRRVAWRLQAQAAGGLSERARQRAHEIANEADLRVLAPRQRLVAAPPVNITGRRFDRRIPPPGSLLQRDYRGSLIAVKVLPDGFEYQERWYRSLSAIATEVTGTRWNGLAFFGLTGERRRGKVRHGDVQR